MLPGGGGGVTNMFIYNMNKNIPEPKQRPKAETTTESRNNDRRPKNGPKPKQRPKAEITTESRNNDQN